MHLIPVACCSKCDLVFVSFGWCVEWCGSDVLGIVTSATRILCQSLVLITVRHCFDTMCHLQFATAAKMLPGCCSSPCIIPQHQMFVIFMGAKICALYVKSYEARHQVLQRKKDLTCFCQPTRLITSAGTTSATACAKPSHHICRLVSMCYVLSSKIKDMGEVPTA